jgi:hypothetical protein
MQETQTRRNLLLLLALPVAVQVAFLVWLWPGFLTDWDSYLYSYGALNFEPVSLGLGRWFYCVFLGILWRIAQPIFSLDVQNSWLVFALSSAVLAIVNVPLFFVLARRWVDRSTAFLATCLVASSPLIGIYAGAVMTETLTLTLMLGSVLLVTRRADRTPSSAALVGSAVLFGLACSIREPVVFFFPLYVGLLWNPGSRLKTLGTHVLLFGCCAGSMMFLGWLGAYLTNPTWFDIYRQWKAGMLHERESMVSGLPSLVFRNLCYYAVFVGVFSPFLVLSIPEQIRWIRRERPVWSLALASGIGLYTVVELVNHTLAFNPRFVIPAGLFLSIFAAKAIVTQASNVKLPVTWLAPGIVAVHLLLIIAAQPLLNRYLYENKSRPSREVFFSLKNADNRAVFVPGELTPVVEYYHRLYNTGWHIVYAGWCFEAEQITQAMESARRKGAGSEFLVVERKYWPSQSYRPNHWKAFETFYRSYESAISASNVAHFNRVDLSPRHRESNQTAPPLVASHPISTGHD